VPNFYNYLLPVHFYDRYTFVKPEVLFYYYWTYYYREIRLLMVTVTSSFRL